MTLKKILCKEETFYARRTENNHTTNPIVLEYGCGVLRSIRRDNMIVRNHCMSAYELIDYLQEVDFEICDKYGKVISRLDD